MHFGAVDLDFQVLQFALRFAQVFLHALENLGVFDGDGRLRGEGGQQRDFVRAEDALLDAVIRIEHTHHAPVQRQRNAQDRAQAVLHHAFEALETFVALGVGGDDRFELFQRHVDDATAEAGLAVGDRLAIPVARGADGEFAVVLFAQHQIGALGAGHGDDRVHDLGQHLVQFQGRGNQRHRAHEFALALHKLEHATAALV